MGEIVCAIGSESSARSATAWTLEIGTNVPSFKFTRQTRQVPSFRLSLQLGTHMYWLHSPNPHVPSCTIFLGTLLPCSELCFYAQLGTLLPSMLCSEPSFLLSSARNLASFCARNPAFFPDCMLRSEPCFLA